jgi:hypothetical protein
MVALSHTVIILRINLPPSHVLSRLTSYKVLDQHTHNMPLRLRFFVWDIAIRWPAREHAVEMALLEATALLAPVIDTFHLAVALLRFFPAEVLAVQPFPDAALRAALDHHLAVQYAPI